ncbi:polysaccharide lyase family 7 protein [Nostoc sp. CHAB 5715]|uniref:polysaccharide lyase family 7 protein n=1 Tax=Nostoc sp. CHAB 5715 TaxID=2780400 RepID=UPI001E61030B|nr:polysaccharide lyase family 7 protein [Nostoc sp. CHAB 5715]MCC5620365.1 polysaccharide lyase family 7 protein [Nostoc sp. CHAB 5715]
MNTKFSNLSFTIAVSAAMIASASVASPTVVSFSDATATSVRGVFVAANAIDKNKNTHWEADAHGTSITARFSSCQRVDDLVLNWYGTNKYTYSVQLSKDNGATWTTVVSNTSGKGNEDAQNVTDQAANAIKIVGDIDSRLRIDELKVNSLGSTNGCTSSGISNPSNNESSDTSNPSDGESSGISNPSDGESSGISNPSDGEVSGGNAQYPADVLDLSKWKITLPISLNSNSNKATEIKQPQLKTYTNSEYFRLNAAKNGVLLKAIAGGARTSTNTAYARSELREMQGDGTESAAWNCVNTDHAMYLEQTLLHTTTNKPEATIGQIHDSKNDLVMVKYFGPDFANGSTDIGKLEARFNNDTTTKLLDSAYKLGDPMTIDIAVRSSGNVNITYKNLRSGVTSSTGTVRMTGIIGSCYFKAGIYIQACSKTDIYGNTNTVCANKNLSANKYETDPYAYAEIELRNITLR